MGVVLLRPPVAVREAALPGAYGVRPAPIAVPREPAEDVRTARRAARSSGAPSGLTLWWRQTGAQLFTGLLAAGLVFGHALRFAVSRQALLELVTALRSGTDLAALLPRAVPHTFVVAVAAIAIFSGGFARPHDEVAALMGIGSEEGALSANGRFVLGPRAAEVPVRDALVRPAVATTALAPSGPRAEILTYKVQPGDTIWDIGARFNVGSYSVLWSNGLDEDAIIKPGQELKIPPIPGTLHAVKADDDLDSIAKKYNVEPAAIVDYNGLRPGEGLTLDKLLVVPGGQLPLVRRAPVAPIAPPVTTIRPATPAQTTVPRVQVPAPAPAGPSGRFAWPARGLITTYFSGWHPGLDVAAAVGTPIGAADGGTVTFTGWDSTGYGYRVVISHGNGYTTTYNHLSSIAVRVGQQVGKGQTIAGMGSTGRSTGSHLHFEILRNGSFVNPLGILG
ncbi:MAG TPA: M23 family metallopeptidase [Chloroflexota bacterium]|nr:M23 family metallopeptidase [Chloroflexota bacterium]